MTEYGIERSCLWLLSDFYILGYDSVTAYFWSLFHCMVRYGPAWLGTVRLRLSLGRFAFPLQFSTAIEWAGLFTCRYSGATSTAVTSS